MPQVLKVEPHQTHAQMNQWLSESPTPAIHKRRLSVKLAAKGGQRAADIAQDVQANVSTVRSWIRDYNRLGPTAHELEGRGGWRHGLMSKADEAKFVMGCRKDAEAGRVMTGQQIRRKAAKELGAMPSRPWVYFLLERHEWRKIAPRPSHVKGSSEAREDFKKNSRKPSPNTAKRRQK
jgi:transposase